MSADALSYVRCWAMGPRGEAPRAVAHRPLSPPPPLPQPLSCCLVTVSSLGWFRKEFVKIRSQVC